MYFSGPVKAVILLFESRRIKNTTCLNASWKEITVYSVWNHKHLVWNKKTNGFSLWCFDCLLVPLTAVLTMPHHHSTWAYYMETTAMKNSPIRVVAEEKKEKLFFMSGYFFFLQILLVVSLILEEKDVTFLLPAFVLQVDHHLAQPLLSCLHHFIFSQSVTFYGSWKDEKLFLE